jgi:hypothetical protein
VHLSKSNLFVLMAIKVFTLFGCLLTSGCMMGNSVIGSGKEARETREIGNFTELDLRGVGSVEVTIGNPRPLVISGDDNILPMIETKVTDGRLTIRSTRPVRPVQPLIIKATASDLATIMLSGAGEIKATASDLATVILSGAGEIATSGIANDNLRATLTGAGTITLSGQTSNLAITLTGTGTVDARKLVAKVATVDMSGAGRIDVSPVVSLHVTITGTGTVTYSGEPKITQKITGVGKLMRRNK